MSMGGAQPLSAEEPAPASEPASPYEPATLESSPVYLELLRKLAFRGDESRRNTESGVRESNMGLTETLRLLGEQGVDQRQGIDNDAESRGVYRSGARLKRNAEQRGREEARGTAMRTATAARIGDLNAELAARLAEMEATRADSELRARETYQSEQARAVMEQEFARRLAALGA